MSSSVKVQPVLGLMSCPVLRPERVTPVSDLDVEQDVGAVGIGEAAYPNGEPMLFLSLHQPAGDVLMAHMTPEQAASVAEQLMARLTALARFVPVRTAETLN